MTAYDDLGIAIPRVLLPRPDVDPTRWAVVACDQYTSEPQYWDDVARFVGDAPSTLKMILPEVYLGTAIESERVHGIRRTMREYMGKGIFRSHQGMVYVERTACGRTRRGIVLCLDLERYDFRRGSQSLVRATEGTIVERLPPRVRIREGAPLELPHILVLIDDPGRTVIEPVAARRDELSPLYDFDLMLGGGHLAGFAASGPDVERTVLDGLRALASPEAFRKKYGVGSDKGVLLFAVGDGNHSLATARTIWEARRASAEPAHPARYALVEIENVHDEGLVFEPIHRVLFGVKADLTTALSDRARYRACGDAREMADVVDRSDGTQKAGLVQAGRCGVLTFTDPPAALAAGTLEGPLDRLLEEKSAARIDYVHGTETAVSLASQPGNAALLLPALAKSDLFRTVVVDGVLPRKTFSMGHAIEKRFYMECRAIEP
jgi:hypothetical protein